VKQEIFLLQLAPHSAHSLIIKTVVQPMKPHQSVKVAAGIAKKQGISKENASAILASAARKASPAAKKKNPRLKKVKG